MQKSFIEEVKILFKINPIFYILPIFLIALRLVSINSKISSIDFTMYATQFGMSNYWVDILSDLSSYFTTQLINISHDFIKIRVVYFVLSLISLHAFYLAAFKMTGQKISAIISIFIFGLQHTVLSVSDNLYFSSAYIFPLFYAIALLFDEDKNFLKQFLATVLLSITIYFYPFLIFPVILGLIALFDKFRHKTWILLVLVLLMSMPVVYSAFSKLGAVVGNNVNMANLLRMIGNSLYPIVLYYLWYNYRFQFGLDKSKVNFPIYAAFGILISYLAFPNFVALELMFITAFLLMPSGAVLKYFLLQNAQYKQAVAIFLSIIMIFGSYQIYSNQKSKMALGEWKDNPKKELKAK